MRPEDVLRDVMDMSESDVPVRYTPKDLSAKEEKKALRRNQNSWIKRDEYVDDIGALYSPNQIVDSIYSPTQFRDDPFVIDEFKDQVDDGVLQESIETNIPKREKKPGPLCVLQRIYTRFASCVSNISVTPRQAVSLVEEEDYWDYTDGETVDYDDQKEQLRRLTSWNTLETDTVETSFTSCSEKENGPTATRLRSRRQSAVKKRTVHFDYPIISSLKECPRPDPRDLPNLYFTEEELGQIEDDRESTYTADDVEVVCVSTSQSSDAEDSQLSSKQRTKSRFGGKSAMDDCNSPPVGSRNMNPPKSSSSSSSGRSEYGRKRHIKSVQIYLRERSKDKSSRS